MKKSIFAVCDLEEAYAVRLTEYMNERRNTPFEVQAFTSLESLAAFAGENHIELLLISTEAMSDAVRKLDVERIVILSEGEPIDLAREEPCVYKYQSSDGLLAEVMNYYAKTAPAHRLLPGAQPEIDILGVYSPIGRVGKTSFALTLGEILAEKKKVLYLNLEDYSGFEALFASNYRSDLSDLVYFARQKEGNLVYRLNGLIQTFQNLDYIPPAFSPCDLRDVGCEEWLELIREIAACGEYQILLLDMGSQLEDWFQLLRQCRKIYMPVLEDPVSRAKLLQFEKNLGALDCADVLEKVQRLHLPRWKENGGEARIHQLTESELGTYVRKLVAGAGKDE